MPRGQGLPSDPCFTFVRLYCQHGSHWPHGYLHLFYFSIFLLFCIGGFPGGSDGKESASNIGDLGLIPGWERSPGEGHGNPLQYSCLENPMDRVAWWVLSIGV